MSSTTPSTAQTSTTAQAPTIQEVAANATMAEREHFQTLWKYSLVLLHKGIIGYFLPRSMVIKLGYGVLRSIAKSLSDTLETDIYIAFEVKESAYFIGQIFDQAYVRTLVDSTSIHRTAFQNPQEQLLLQEGPHENSSTPSSDHVRPSTLSTTAAKVPKPRNMWIIYRQEKHSFILSMSPGMHTSQISSIISAMWKHECEEVKDYYKKLAEEEKANHRLLYPDYKCSPRKSSEIKKRKRSVDDNGNHLNSVSEQPRAVEVSAPEIPSSQTHVQTAPVNSQWNDL